MNARTTTLIGGLAVAGLVMNSVCASAARIHHANHNWQRPQSQLHAPDAIPGRLDPNGVYVDGVEIGRDPDPNVRQRLYDEYFYMRGW